MGLKRIIGRTLFLKRIRIGSAVEFKQIKRFADPQLMMSAEFWWRKDAQHSLNLGFSFCKLYCVSGLILCSFSFFLVSEHISANQLLEIPIISRRKLTQNPRDGWIPE